MQLSQTGRRMALNCDAPNWPRRWRIAPPAGGARALGIHYFSKHGTHWSCSAVWLRDDVAGALDAGPGQPVAPPADNAALAAVLDIYNLTAR